MGGRGSSSNGGHSNGENGDDAEDYYRSVEPGVTDFIHSGDDLDQTEQENYLSRFARWLAELGDEIAHYFTDPIDPNSPAARYFRRQAELTAKLRRGEPLTAADLTLTEDEFAFLADITFAFGPGALSNGPVTIAGSRSIPAAIVERIERMAAALSRAGCTMTTGCATGVDEIFAKYANQIYAIFDKTGKGAISASNVAGVLTAEQRGALVHYLAGGELKLPPVARLVNRSDKTAKASDTILGIFTNEISTGTTRELATAAREGKNVFAVSTAGNALPRIDSIGHWEPIENAQGIWEGLHRWVKSELPLTEATGPQVLNKYTSKIGPDDVYIGRPSQYGNPFKIGVDGTREEVIDQYRQHVMANPGLLEEIRKLKGKNLVCFCHPKPCHGDVILELANKINKP